MNTKIRTSFGLALLMAIGVIGTMFALGMFTAKPASAAFDGTVTVSVTPTKARSIAEYTISVTSGATQNAIPVGGSITVTFNTKTTVPSSIAASAIKLKSTIITGAGTPSQLVNSSAVTVSGRAVTITVPDMDSAAGNGDQGIGANSALTITFTQAAGIQNPNQASTTLTVDIKSSTDTTAVTSSVYDTPITSFVSFSPSTAARGATLTVTGGGFEKNCLDCKIRFNHDEGNTAPTTGSFGSGSINADGVFSGTVTLSSTTSAGGFVWVTDSAGAFNKSTTKFVQKAGATPTATAVSPGSTVSVVLVDFSGGAVMGTSAVTVAGTTVTNTDQTLTSSGGTPSLTPFKFLLPVNTGTGSQVIKITDPTGKSASFTLEVVLRTLTVTPSTAAPGQSITVSGTGFDKTSGTIAIAALTATSTGGGPAEVNPALSIPIDVTGNWSFATRMPTLEVFAAASSNAIKFNATDSQLLTGATTAAGFSRTPRTITLTPATASPGESITVTVTGMTVDTGEVSGANAEFKVTAEKSTDSSVKLTFTGTSTFPIGSDGSGSGTVTIPANTAPTTYTFKATDNAASLNVGGTPLLDKAKATSDRSATANLKVPSGSITVSPDSASTGNSVTVAGTAFPPNTTGTVLSFGGVSAIPVGGFTTDADGAFSVVTQIPAASSGGSLSPGTKIVRVTIGGIPGSTTAFGVPDPKITIEPAEAQVEETIVITGVGFNALGTVTVLNIGNASALPSPAPRASRGGDITATVLVPLLNPGTYTVVMSNGSGFSATASFKAIATGAKPASTQATTQEIFADVISNGDNLVRVWRFDNATQTWAFYDPRPAFELANTLLKTGSGDIVWVNVNTEQIFQGQTLFPGWNLISLS